MLGGLLMVVVGVLYLLFEGKLRVNLSSSKKTNTTKPGNEISRSLIGIQVGTTYSFEA